MKIGRILVITLLLSAILLGGAFVVSAEETDWSQVDWTQVDWYEIDWNQVDWENTDIHAMIRALYSNLDICDGTSRFWNWVENESSWHILFKISMCTDAASSEAASGVIYDRFAMDSFGFIQALALEEADVQEEMVWQLCYGGYPPDEFSQVLGAVQLPDTATDAEIAVWQAILYRAENSWGVVPSTGDPIVLPVAMLIVTGAGLAVLIPGKKRFARS